ncbi:S9 family peptidase [Chitinophaga parva]|uniref:S9 family peptidase n=1 Tax=Chitinophaga parva TaxID=2169414 RepID=A0A2T7BDR9_9BACT|nr:DPP IV N-terminal domain-containing protein [Chitinophaga parva]PUZ23225.1 S9 family peptidase [Chitinophaga parva]
MPDPILKWSPDGHYRYQAMGTSILAIQLSTGERTVKLKDITPPGSATALRIRDFAFSNDQRKVLLFANSKRVWRYETRGDYFVYDTATRQVQQLGKSLPASSLMFAKFSPDGSKVAYVSDHNLYVETLATGEIRPLTTNGTRHFINGTFDWVYEEEMSCRDGFRWSPDGQSIAYWQLDATNTRDFLMIDNTDSLYSFTVPVEYPIAGQDPAAARIGVLDLASGNTTWMQLPGDAHQHYLPRMEWAPGGHQLIVQQLNRRQNESRIFLCDAANGNAHAVYTETDSAWVDIRAGWDADNSTGWDWLQNGKAFVWVSEKDGWRHAYRIGLDGKETLLTPGNYDLIRICKVDEKAGLIYALASPENAGQQYLYRIPLKGGPAVRITPANEMGTHNYTIDPYGDYAVHEFSNYYCPPATEYVHLPDHKSAKGEVETALRDNKAENNPLTFFKVTTPEGVVLDGWMKKPANFDPAKKYPILFYVYGEPAGATAKDEYGAGKNFLYQGSMEADGYIYASMDNRGAPLPRGRAWRKAIYRNIGRLNVHDQAMGAKALMEQYHFIDTSRVAVWGWSGGGSSTLNLLFQYPKIYKTGIAIAAVGDLRTYDNIYQERYMGIPQETMADYVAGSAVHNARYLEGNLLYIHGTGDDNVHYTNAERLINELVKYNKQFQLMSYPNRSHGLSEGEGTFRHLTTLYTTYLREHCAPGGR